MMMMMMIPEKDYFDTETYLLSNSRSMTQLVENSEEVVEGLTSARWGTPAMWTRYVRDSAHDDDVDVDAWIGLVHQF